MATYEHAERSTTRNVAAALGRHALIVTFTGVETLALGIWLALVVDAPVASQTALVGLGILLGGLIIEHFLTDLAVNGFDVSFPGGAALTFSVTETLLWALWLGIAEEIGGLEGIVVAGGFLALLLVPQHTMEDNVLRGERILDELFNLNTLGFSVVEAAGATVWLIFVLLSDRVTPVLESVGTVEAGQVTVEVAAIDPALVGLAVLGAALLLEHVIGVSFSRHG